MIDIECQNLFFNSLASQFKIDITASINESSGIIYEDDLNSIILEDSFLFGVISKKIDEKIDLPIFSCLVERSFWRKS